MINETKKTSFNNDPMTQDDDENEIMKTIREEWKGGRVDGCKSRVKDCLQQLVVEKTLLDGRMEGWVDGCKSQVKDCLQQSKIKFGPLLCLHLDPFQLHNVNNLNKYL